jgi:hypothetical protein
MAAGIGVGNTPIFAGTIRQAEADFALRRFLVTRAGGLKPATRRGVKRLHLQVDFDRAPAGGASSVSDSAARLRP